MLTLLVFDERESRQEDDLRGALDQVAERELVWIARRDPMPAVGVGLPSDKLETARLLVSELVTNSVRHVPTIEGATLRELESSD